MLWFSVQTTSVFIQINATDLHRKARVPTTRTKREKKGKHFSCVLHGENIFHSFISYHFRAVDLSFL